MGEPGGAGAGGSTTVGGGNSTTTDPCSSEGPTGPDAVTFAPNVSVSTVAGSADYGTQDGPGASATFSNPVGVVVETEGSLLVADYDSNLVRRVGNDGNVSTVTKQAGFAQPFGLGFGKNGELFVSTDYDPAGMKNPQSGTIWQLNPGSGMAMAMASDMGRTRSFAALADGRLAVSNYENNRIYVVDPASGIAAELAGHGAPGCGSFADGAGAEAGFSVPYGIVVLSDGRIIVADHSNHRLRAVTVQGVVTTFAGDGGSGTVDGPLLQARFAGPEALAVDSHDNIYVSDNIAHRIRRVGADGDVTTVAGDGNAGWQDGAGSEAQFFGQEGIALSADASVLYVADGTSGTGKINNRIRKITIGH